jgi:cold shock protein
VSEQEREKGQVIFFSKEKGYGFIRRDSGGPDLFCHFTGIAGEGYRNLQQDQRVEFSIVTGQKGIQAADVRPL